MSSFGVLSTGFAIKPVSEILSEIVADELSLIAPDIDTSPEEPLGQLNGILAEKMGELWELAQTAFNAFNRGAAGGALLDNIGALTGSLREGPTPSTVFCTSVFTQPGTYPKGSLVAQLPLVPRIQFSNQSPIVVPALFNGNPVSNTNPFPDVNEVFQSTQLGPDFGNALIAANAGNGGNTPPFTGALTGQVPVVGWKSVVDTSAPVLGTNIEQDAPYRVRQVEELAAVGSCTLDAIAARIEEVLNAAPFGVINASVKMFENTSGATNSLGMPPDSIMAVVFDGLIPPNDNQQIGQTLWNNKPAGTATFGAISVTVLDSQGVQRVVQFSRAAQVPIFISVDVAVAAGSSFTQVQTLVRTAIIAASQGQPFTLYGQTVTPSAASPTTLLPGVDVVASAFRAVAQGQAGVIDVTAIRLGTTVSPTGTANIPIGATQVGVVQAGVVVNVSQFVP